MLEIRQVLKEIYKAKVAYKELTETPKDFSKLLALHSLTTRLKLGLGRLILNGTLLMVVIIHHKPST